jgi:hypothetical protein
MMLAVVWDSTGFVVVIALENGCKFNSGSYVNKVLMLISEWWGERGCGTFRKLIVDADNARPHKARISQQFIVQSGMRMAIHLPYSPDITPSDFYLFGHMKGRLIGESFEMGENLFSAVEVILGTLEKSILNRVFLE